MNLKQEFVENCAKLCGLNPESCQDAYALSEKDARTQKRLSIEDLLVWNETFTGEEALVEEVNTFLQLEEPPIEDLCFFLAHVYRECKNPFLAMLLVNYVLNFLNRPIFVFRLQEKEELQNAVQDEHKMRLYIGQKLRENVRIQGCLYTLKEDYEGLSARYVDPQTQEEILVEWHPLYMSLH